MFPTNLQRRCLIRLKKAYEETHGNSPGKSLWKRLWESLVGEEPKPFEQAFNNAYFLYVNDFRGGTGDYHEVKNYTYELKKSLYFQITRASPANSTLSLMKEEDAKNFDVYDIHSETIKSFVEFSKNIGQSLSKKFDWYPEKFRTISDEEKVAINVDVPDYINFLEVQKYLQQEKQP